MLSTLLLLPAIVLAFSPLGSVRSTTSISKRESSGFKVRSSIVHRRRNRRSADHCRSKQSPLGGTGLGNPGPITVASGGDVILSDTDVAITFGQATPNACDGKKMTYANGKGTFDKETLTELLNLYHNTWGSAAATQTSSQTTQCHAFDSKAGVTIWTTTYDWKATSEKDKNQVKSYCNAGWAGKPVQISALRDFKTTWKWSYVQASDDLVADVSYDIFTSKSATCTGQGGGCASHEVMIWLSARGGALPAGSKVSKAPLMVQNRFSFDVYQGSVGGIPVISLVPTSRQEYTNFSADLIPVMHALSDYGLEADEYISTIGAGTEPFLGAATLDTKHYSLRIS